MPLEATRALGPLGAEKLTELGLTDSTRRLELIVGGTARVFTVAKTLPGIFGLYLQVGRIDVGFLGGAQIDRFGNLNTTVIGDYAAPKTRLPGSGGACEIAINAKEILVIMRQSTRSFVKELDFRTSPGNLGGAVAAAKTRAAQGWGGSGPSGVITDLGVYGFDDDGEMALRSLHPGATLDEVRASIGWEIRIPQNVPATPTPRRPRRSVPSPREVSSRVAAAWCSCRSRCSGFLSASCVTNGRLI
jgi:glutaconate CoA-transferase subunit B